MSLLGAVLLVLTIVIITLIAIVQHLKLRKRFATLRGPRSFPFIGHLLQIKPKPEGFMAQVMGTSVLYPEEPRMVMLWITTRPYVMLYGAEVVEPVLSSSRHLDKGIEYRMLHPWLGLGLVTSYADKWRPRRKLLTPTFHYDILKDFLDVFNRQSAILVQRLQLVASADQPVDITTYVALCTLDIICETSMGRTINAQFDSHSEYVTAITEINDIIGKRQRNPFMWSDTLFWYFGNGQRHAWCLDVLHGFTRKVITERQADVERRVHDANTIIDNNGDDEPEKRHQRLAFLDLLLNMVDKGLMPIEDVQSEVDTFMFEGHDTTSTALSWALHMMGCYRSIQRKAQAEIDRVLSTNGSFSVSLEHLAELKYLECCLKETLRLFPSVPMITRVLSHDQQIDQFVIPKDTQVIINTFMVHRDPKHWPDPELFDPDRFLPENSNRRHSFAFLPFSAGSRNCIGQRFAMMEEKTVMSWILYHFDVESMQRRDQVRPKAEIILRPENGIFLKFRQRRPIVPLEAS